MMKAMLNDIIKKKPLLEKKTKHGKKQLIDWWKIIDFI
jgi:hypothetical protein